MLRNVKHDPGAATGRSSGYSPVWMRTTPEIQAKLRARLQEAVDQAGSADALGRALGWTNGGPIRNSLKGTRNVTMAFLHSANESEHAWLHGWFDDLLSPVSKVDVAVSAAKRSGKLAWPFTRLTQEEWKQLGQIGRAIVEDVAASKAHELLKEAASRKQPKQA